MIRSSLVLSLTQIAEAWVGTALHDYASQRLSSLTLFNTSEIGTGTTPRLQPASALQWQAACAPSGCQARALWCFYRMAAAAPPWQRLGLAASWPPQPVPDSESEAALRPEDSPASSSQARWPGPTADVQFINMRAVISRFPALGASKQRISTSSLTRRRRRWATQAVLLCVLRETKTARTRGTKPGCR